MVEAVKEAQPAQKKAETGMAPRGGAAVALLESGGNGKSASFLVVAGANRERQFADFWRVLVTIKDNMPPLIM